VRLPITLACNASDRTAPLLTGEVVPEGVDINPMYIPIEELFFRQVHGQEFDVSEMSLASHAILLSRDESPWVGIPVFLSRVFRHGSIFVRRSAGIHSPTDLVGRRVGIAEYQMTAGVFVRGMLRDEYGVDARDIEWHSGGQEQPGRHERLSLPTGVSVTQIPEDATLGTMLTAGELEGLVAARMPRAFLDGHPDVVRLFPNYADVEADYYRRTSIFPIMHLVVVRRSLAEAHPWLPMSLFKAFSRVKDAALDSAYDWNGLRISVPWLVAEIERTRAVFGSRDIWPYGLEGNRPTLEAFCRYMHEQGLVSDSLAPEDLFAPTTRSVSRI
jgi:4,5-dihydroxyphthalate decarboxylase